MSKKEQMEYIVSCISFDDAEKNNLAPYEKVQEAYSIFRNEMMRYNKNRSEHQAATDWLQGLCSTVAIEFRNYAILELLEKWGVITPETPDRKKDQFLANWYRVMASNFLQLAKKKASSSFYKGGEK